MNLPKHSLLLLAAMLTTLPACAAEWATESPASDKLSSSCNDEELVFRPYQLSDYSAYIDFLNRAVAMATQEGKPHEADECPLFPLRDEKHEYYDDANQLLIDNPSRLYLGMLKNSESMRHQQPQIVVAAGPRHYRELGFVLEGFHLQTRYSMRCYDTPEQKQPTTKTRAFDWRNGRYLNGLCAYPTQQGRGSKILENLVNRQATELLLRPRPGTEDFYRRCFPRCEFEETIDANVQPFMLFHTESSAKTHFFQAKKSLPFVCYPQRDAYETLRILDQ